MVLLLQVDPVSSQCLVQPGLASHCVSMLLDYFLDTRSIGKLYKCNLVSVPHGKSRARSAMQREFSTARGY